MAMTSRERMLTALHNGRPDRLPCQVHAWMPYYLNTYLGGIDQWQAYERFGMDFAIYMNPTYRYDEKDLARWDVRHTDLGQDAAGNHCWAETIITPKGELHRRGAYNCYTGWITDHMIKNERDFEMWDEFSPVPNGVDFTELRQARERLGDRGIIRVNSFSPGQGSPWQSFCLMADTGPAIMWALMQPDFIRHAMESIVQKTLRVTQMWEGIPADVVETGGGAGSDTVISPDLFREFCLPYDRRQNELMHEAGLKVVYHLCGGVMQMLDLVVESGADGLETMTPASMGGNCDLREASRRVGEKLFFVGGFDQKDGFERGTPEAARRLVFECFEATKDHAGYILAPSDHFFHGDPACVQAFVDAARECVYDRDVVPETAPVEEGVLTK